MSTNEMINPQDSAELVQRVAAVHSKRAKMFAQFKSRTRKK